MADRVVRVELQGGTDQFRKAFGDAARASNELGKTLGTIEKQIQGSFSSMASGLGPVGDAMSALGPAGLIAAAGIGAVATALGGLVAFVGESVKGLVALGGKLTDLSAQTGLSTTTLQELRFAGALVGVSMEEAANAVGKMQKAITAGDTVFARLGLSLGAIRKLDVAGQFDAVAAAIKSIKDPTQQTAAAMEAFGRGGASILPLIKSDTAAAREEFHRLGLEIGGPTAKAADDLGDAGTKLSFAWEGVKNQLAAGIVESGALTAVTEGLKEVIGGLASFLQENKDVIRGFFALGLTAAKELASFIPTIKTGFNGLIAVFGALNPALAQSGAELKFLLQSAAGLAAFKDKMAAARAAAAEPPKDKTFTGKGDEAAAAKALAAAEKYQRELEKIAAEEKKAAEESNKRWAAEEAAVEKVNAAVKKRQSDAKVSIFGTSPEVAAEAIATFDNLAIALGAQIEYLGDGEVAYNGLGAAIGSLTEGQLTAYEAQLVKLEKASRDDANANGLIATTLGNVRAALREAGDGFEKGSQQIEAARDTTLEWGEALDIAAGALSQFGDTDLGNLIGQLSQVFKQAQAIAAQIKSASGGSGKWGDMSSAGKFQTGAAVGGAAIGIAMDAYAGANTNVAKSTAKGALTGAAKGAMIGSIVPGIGTAVGAVVGGVIGGVAGFLGSKKKIKEMLKGYDDALIQQFGSLEKAKKAADKYGIALGKALDSKKPKEIQAAMEKLNKALEKRANLEQGLMTAQGNVETLQDLTKAIDNPLLKAAVQALATKVSDELAKAGLGFAATGPLRDSAEFGAAQNIAGAAAGTVAGLRQAGVVDQGVLDAAAGVASEVQKQAFDAAKAAGMDDAAATKASLGAISPLLREQLNASIASGRKLDAKVQEQIDLAKANGIDILADPAIEAVGVQKDILAAIKGQGQRDLGTNLLDARDRFGGEKSGIPSHAKGIGYVPHTGPALLHRGESVLPANFQMPTMRSVSGMNASSAALRGGSGGSQAPVTIAPTIQINGSNLSEAQLQAVAVRAVADGVRLGIAQLTGPLDRRYQRL